MRNRTYGGVGGRSREAPPTRSLGEEMREINPSCNAATEDVGNGLIPAIIEYDQHKTLKSNNSGKF